MSQNPKRPRSILRVLTSVNPASGGPAEFTRQIHKVFERDGVRDVIVTVDPPDAEFLATFPAEVHALGPQKSGYGYSDKLESWLDKHIDEFEIVLVHSIWQYPGIAVRKVALKHRKRYWVFVNGMLDPYFNRASRLKHLKKLLYWPWQHAVLRDSAGVLFTCKEECLLARKSFKPYTIREEVVRYGTALPEFDEAACSSAFLEKFPDLRNKRFLLFLSRVHPKKGLDLLLRSLSRVSGGDDLHLVIAGPYEADYRSELEGSSLSSEVSARVHWVGMLGGDLKWGAFCLCEAFILPSHQENFGIAVVESLACGKPVLISNKINIWREIEEDGVGIVEDDTQEGVDRLLKKWIETDPAVRSRMSDQAKITFRNRFWNEQTALDLYEIWTRSRRPDST